jgi:hypothetical protein
MQNYRGYTCYRSLLQRGHFYAYPICDLTTENKITASSADELRRKIDQAIGDNLNPWELPSVEAAPIAA